MDKAEVYEALIGSSTLSTRAIYVEDKEKEFEIFKNFWYNIFSKWEKAPFGKWSKPCDFPSHIAGSNPARSIQ